MSTSAKCACVRAVKKQLQLCGRNARFEYDGFCCQEHMNDAKQYAAPSYDEHVARVHQVMKNKSLVLGFNERVRPMFASIIMAGKQKEEAEFVCAAGAAYGNQAEAAWDTTRAVFESNAADSFSKHVSAVSKCRLSIKRKMDEQSVMDLFSNNLCEPDDAHVPEVPVAKRVKVEVKPEPVVEPDHVDIPAGVPLDADAADVGNGAGPAPAGGDAAGGLDADVAHLNRQVEHAAQQPLPDDDEDMDEDLL